MYVDLATRNVVGAFGPEETTYYLWVLSRTERLGHSQQAAKPHDKRRACMVCRLERFHRRPWGLLAAVLFLRVFDAGSLLAHHALLLMAGPVNRVQRTLAHRSESGRPEEGFHDCS